MKNTELAIHLRVYKGKTLTFKANGESANENHIVKLMYGTAEYKKFLSLLSANGIIKAEVEKVLDLSKVNQGKEKNQQGYYEEVSEFKSIQEEINVALNSTGVIALTPDQERIAALEAKLEAFTGGKSKALDSDKEELNAARAKYVELYGKKGSPAWNLEELNQKISEFKPE